MLLRQLEIKNFRSLEHICLEKLDTFNVLIGRNNSGKSSVFSVLAFVDTYVNARSLPEWQSLLTGRDTSRPLDIRFVLAPDDRERAHLIDLLTGNAQLRARLSAGSSFRQIEFFFRSTPGPNFLLHLRHVRIMAEHNDWGSIHSLRGHESAVNPTARVVLLQSLVSTANETISRALLESEASISDISFPHDYAGAGRLQVNDPATDWLLHRLDDYLSSAFFFNPFRHSSPQLEAQETYQLAQDGSNLAQVLHTISSNDRTLFEAIEHFVHAALPDVGRLHARIQTNKAEVSFQRPGGYHVKLHDMGGGVEQLLMVATVLHTAKANSAIFLEEPESHLHAGAQRFLLERLYASPHQVFLTTHSPIFVNSHHLQNMFRVSYSNSRTSITPLVDVQVLSDVLEDIGSRNSDVLLSDAVLFVEGPGDQRVFQAWSSILGMSLDEHNVTLVPMGGAEFADRTAPVRSALLEQISSKAPVAHLFVLDRDERSEDNVAHLSARLEDRLHLLCRREIENYLLVPRAILQALGEKYHSSPEIANRVAAMDTMEVQAIIDETAAGLFNRVLLNRIRAAVPGLRGGLFSREIADQIADEVHNANLAALIEEKLSSRVAEHIRNLNLGALVEGQCRLLTQEWENPSRHLELAPGEEILAAVFSALGGKYEKPKDTERIACAMTRDEIPPEIHGLIERLVQMTDRRTQ